MSRTMFECIGYMKAMQMRIHELEAKNVELENKLQEALNGNLLKRYNEEKEEAIAKNRELEKKLHEANMRSAPELEKKLAETDRKYTEDITHMDKKLKIACDALGKMDRCFPDCSSYHVNTKCDCNSGIASEALSKIKSEGL